MLGHRFLFQDSVGAAISFFVGAVLGSSPNRNDFFAEFLYPLAAGIIHLEGLQSDLWYGAPDPLTLRIVSAWTHAAADTAQPSAHL